MYSTTALTAAYHYNLFPYSKTANLQNYFKAANFCVFANIS